ncbi:MULTISPECIES: transposase, partial [unclassified Wolbachia]|uniref:transposase n=1 Tax=unclassified Wolbachia TaxID=2640676 RepID=UPI0034E1A5D7
MFHIPCSRKSPVFLSFTSLANPQLGYIGLTPRQYSSGEVDRHGSISKMGPAE